MSIHVGTSGWSYGHWTGVLYPDGLPPARRLDHYLDRFRTAELNASYYRWPSDASFEHWRRRLPPDFLLSVKAPGALTHVKRLFAPEGWLARIARSLARLGQRRGAAYCVMSGARLPCVLRATAPFVYVRLHGPDPGHLYAGSYSDTDLGWWADRIREWHDQGRDVFAYFNNDGGGNAVRNALTLGRLVGVSR